MSSVSVIDVAHRAGVSLGTVSNVLNRPDRVSPATRERVLTAIEELGFIRNEAARQLRAGRSRTIGVVVLDIGNPFFTEIAAGVESAATAAGLSVVLCNSGESGAREEHYLSLLQEQRSFGILVTPVRKLARIDEIRRQGTACILMDRPTNGRRCSVSVDDVIGGRLAAAHLLELGHERIAFVGGPTSLSQVALRLDGARRALKEAGLPPDSLRVFDTPGLNVVAGRAAGVRVAALPSAERPTAAFCANDLVALGLLQELIRLQINVPRDLAIVGYDDIDLAALAAVPLTSIRRPRSQVGHTATNLLIEEVARPAEHVHRRVVFEPQLIVRESTTRWCG